MLESLEGLIIGLASVNGLNTESMARGHGFRFMEIGRRLERALYTLNLLRTGCELPHETEKVVWEMVLAMTDSLMTYRRRYASATEAGAVLDLLLARREQSAFGRLPARTNTGPSLESAAQEAPATPERRRTYHFGDAHNLTGDRPGTIFSVHLGRRHG